LKIEVKGRIQTGKLLQKERNSALAYLDIAGVIIVALNRDQSIAIINKRGCELLGYDESEIIGKKWIDNFLPERDREQTRVVFSELMAGNIEPVKYHENYILTKNNKERLIAWNNSVIRDDKGKIIATLASGEDITKQRQIDDALKKSEEKFRIAFRTSPDAINLNSVEGGVYIDINEGFTKIMGYSREDIIGKSSIELNIWNDPKDRERLVSGLKKHGVVENLKADFVGKNGQIRTGLMSARLLSIDDQDIILSITRDITKQRKLEALLQQAQKMEAIGTLAGGIAHDFNNILFPIMGRTEMLLEDIPEDSPFHASLNEIFTSALRASELAKQILTFSRQDINELSLVKIQPVIKEALKLIRSTIPTTIEIKQYIRNDCGAIKADPTQIHQIVMNLTTNAYHAMEETGGELKVTLKEVKLGDDDVISPDMEPGTYACLTIADTGTGMNKDILEKIFDPFFTTKKQGKGTGMGLSVVHGIVNSMGGEIQAYSEPGKGTEFKVYFPVEKSAFEKQSTQTKEPVRGGTERILLVDDEEAIIEMEKQMLERLGYQVTSCTSSTKALETFWAGPDKFDLVITDMAMPNMAGDKLAAELIEIRSDIPILLCTGFSGTISEEKAASLGIKGFILKPIVMKDLAKKIRELLDEN